MPLDPAIPPSQRKAIEDAAWQLLRAGDPSARLTKEARARLLGATAAGRAILREEETARINRARGRTP